MGLRTEQARREKTNLGLGRADEKGKNPVWGWIEQMRRENLIWGWIEQAKKGKPNLDRADEAEEM